MRFLLMVVSVVVMSTPMGWAEAQQRPQEITVTGTEFRFDPARFRAEAGTPLRIVFVNRGSVGHNLTVPAYDVGTPTIRPGQSATVTFTPQEPGTIGFLCTVPGHSEAGMRGQIIVE